MEDYHDTKTRQKILQNNENDSPIPLLLQDAKMFNERVANQIQQQIDKTMHCEEDRFIPGMQDFFNVHNQCDSSHTHTYTKGQNSHDYLNKLENYLKKINIGL